MARGQVANFSVVVFVQVIWMTSVTDYCPNRFLFANLYAMLTSDMKLPASGSVAILAQEPLCS